MGTSGKGGGSHRGGAAVVVRAWGRTEAANLWNNLPAATLKTRKKTMMQGGSSPADLKNLVRKTSWSDFQPWTSFAVPMATPRWCFSYSHGGSRLGKEEVEEEGRGREGEELVVVGWRGGGKRLGFGEAACGYNGRGGGWRWHGHACCVLSIREESDREDMTSMVLGRIGARWPKVRKRREIGWLRPFFWIKRIFPIKIGKGRRKDRKEEKEKERRREK